MRANEFLLEEGLREAAYEGNIGVEEMFKFQQVATPEQKKELQNLVAQKLIKAAWKLIRGVTGGNLVGKEFGESRSRVNEIDYTPGIEPLQISFEELVANSNVVGDLDNKEVYVYDDAGSQVYFTLSDSVEGLVILQGQNLIDMKNYSGTPGVITMLVGFVTHRLKMPVKITKDEPLTRDGITWLCSLIKAGGRGLKVTDQTGRVPNADELYKEWTTSMNRDSYGDTEITIESRIKRHLKTINEFKQEGRLMPATWFIGDKTLL